MNTKNLVSAFKVVSFVEALTWVWLLYGMYGKWIGGDATAVARPGMTHGIVFMVLAVLTLLVARVLKWNAKTLLLGLVATVVPFCSVVFERWAERTGKLTVAGEPTQEREPADAIGG